jgi:hypothetical protein
MTSKLEDRWLAFHVANPEVYETICKICQSILDAGEDHWSIAGVWEQLRLERLVKVRMAKKIRLPNNHRAYYARLWLEDHPNHSGFFRKCALRSKGEGGPRDEYGIHADDERYEDLV